MDYSELYNKLDSPAWYALTETHASFSEGTDTFKRYDPGIVLFSGLNPANKIMRDLDLIVKPGESIFLFDEFPPLPGNYQVETIVQCMQMFCSQVISLEINADIQKLGEKNKEEMFQLVSEVFPGYYLRDTYRMGDYEGIFEKGKLIAMAGERIKMNGFTEISAVVTHPDFTGRKYASQLMAYLNNKNLHNGITPFLHTGINNERAIRLYEFLGYEKRRVIPVTKIKRVR